MEYNELYHHGVKDQRWGIRRYQNKDGSLTLLGRKRRNSLSKKTDNKKSDGDKPKRSLFKKSEKKDVPAKKSFSEMTDDEIKTAIARMTLEKQAYGLQNDLSTLNPKKVSSGQKFVNDILKPAVVDMSKKMLSGALNNLADKALGKNAKNVVDELQELRNKTDKRKLEKDNALLDDFFASRKKTKKKPDGKNEEKPDGKNEEKPGKDAQNNEPLTGTVVGEGTSTRSSTDRNKGNKGTKTTSKSDIFDADFEDVSDRYSTAGMKYVQLLLDSD